MCGKTVTFLHLTTRRMNLRQEGLRGRHDGFVMIHVQVNAEFCHSSSLLPKPHRRPVLLQYSQYVLHPPSFKIVYPLIECAAYGINGAEIFMQSAIASNSSGFLSYVGRKLSSNSLGAPAGLQLWISMIFPLTFETVGDL